MPSLYSLICSVCKGEYFSKDEWSQHLSSETHQLLGRMECLQFWRSPQIKECCVVVFSSFPLSTGGNNGTFGGADRVIKALSNHPTRFMTDFLWWDDRPFIGLAQFESRKRAMEVVGSLSSSSDLLIDGDRIQGKWAMDVMDLEWTAMLPGEQGKEMGSSSITTTRKRPLETEQESVEESISVPNKQPKIMEENGGGEDEDSNSVPEAAPEGTTATDKINWAYFTGNKPNQHKPFTYDRVPSSLGSSKTSIQIQFWRVRKSVFIPHSTHKTTMQTIADLRSQIRKKVRSAEVIMFRNRFLRIKNPACLNKSDELMIFTFRAESDPHHIHSFAPILDAEVTGALQMRYGFQFAFINDALKKQDNRHDPNGTTLKYKSNGPNFRLLNTITYLAEVQMCRLLDYLCQFDSRCHSIMSLACYWSKVNEAYVGEVTSNLKTDHVNLPEPNTLLWLVTCFLCNRKIVPTPQEIQMEPHTILKDRFTGYDIGFQADQEYLRRWTQGKGDPDGESTDEFILRVLALSQEFLEFCGKLAEPGNWILNTRDGEVLDADKLFNITVGVSGVKVSKRHNKGITKMSDRDLDKLRTKYKPPTENLNVSEGESSAKPTGSLYMIHPFVPIWKFSISKDIHQVLTQMRESGVQLKQFLTMYKMKKLGTITKPIGNLEKVLKAKKGK